ncbi:hypothetical protein [Rhodococcus sp. IEGM 1408]|uniref:hypothetical protein n=1 Tax=Rhodococcus sp. IEGM 1408 TaxID=3082220 RepID=UPI002952D00A|nr:hypothetical protein [Rhodococcus sp. IEGM 1408]MDV8001459.1 hypothetical protein [Rhodococcus sp. IEGM 1408]
MTKPSNTAAIASATGRPWDEWAELLDQAGARELGHTAIARLTLEHMPAQVERAEWWAQGTAVAYEQHAGLRVPGQSCDGDFQLSASRTVIGDKDAALQAWVALVGSREEFGGVPVEAPAATSSSEKWRYWRVPLADGTRVAVNFSDKAGGKCSIGLGHTKLDSAEAIDFWRPVWKELLGQLR